MHLIISTIVNIVSKMGYLGIVAAMFLESSFFPFPSEVVIPPSGYLASQGEMSLGAVIVLGTLGSLLGALFNYWISLVLGRPLILKFGRYLGLTEKRYSKAESYFRAHGEVGTFVGRLVPGLRQYISLPAGLARMNLWRFALFTALGAGAWVTVLAYLGYFIGNNQELLKKSLHQITIYIAISLALLILLYSWWHRRRSHWAASAKNTLDNSLDDRFAPPGEES